MNKNNVVPYGKFVHEVAQKGGVESYKAMQQTLLDFVKEQSYQEGISVGKKKMYPFLFFTSICAVVSSVCCGYKFAKEKITEKNHLQEKLAKDAEEAESILLDIPLHEEILEELEGENNNG